MSFHHQWTACKTEKYTTKQIQHLHFTIYLMMLLHNIQEALVLMFLERQIKKQHSLKTENAGITQTYSGAEIIKQPHQNLFQMNMNSAALKK